MFLVRNKNVGGAIGKYENWEMWKLRMGFLWNPLEEI